MTNDVVIITGVNGALGSALTKTYLSNTYNVIGIDKQKSTKHKIDYLQFDFSKINDSTYRNNKKKSLVNLINKRPIKALINNAAYQKISSFEKIKFSDIEDSLSINFKAPFFLIQSLVSLLSKNKSKVINIGTIHNQLTIPNFFCYASSKMAMSSITRSLSIELGSNIDFVEVSPGAIYTPLLKKGFKSDAELDKKRKTIPSLKFIQPEELAKLVFDACNNENINGLTLSIDGGSKFLLSN